MNYKLVYSKKHTDERGYLVEFLKRNELSGKNKIFGQIYFVTFNHPNVIRGNHYHKKTEEWFGIVNGSVKVALVDVKTNKRKFFTLHASKNKFIRLKIGAYIAHAFKSLTPSAILLDYANKQYDQKNTDRHQYTVIEK